MTSEELMRLSAEKALREMSWESIEFLFRPLTGVDLLLRIDFDGMKQKITDWCRDDSPDAMPFRFRGPYIAKMHMAVERERFYRAMDLARKAACPNNDEDSTKQRDDVFRKIFNS